MENQSSAKSRIKKRQTKRRFRKKFIFTIAVPFLLILFAGLWFVVSFYIKADEVISDAYEDDGRDKSELRDQQVDPTKDNISILIIGVDESEHRGNSGNSRSDTLLLATLNKIDNSIKLVSIPRDSYVYIPEVGYNDKIAHAHAFGGHQATIETVESLLDVPVDYYIKINFEAFIEIVDAINGVTVDVPYEFWEQDSQDRKRAIHLLPGEQTLNGEEALALARTRKLDNDIERGKRQMEIIKAAMKKAMSIDNIFKLDDILQAIGSNMTTNMTFNEMTGLISYGTNGKNLNFETISLEGYDYQPANVYYWQLDEDFLNDTKYILKDHLDINTNLTTNDSSNNSNY